MGHRINSPRRRAGTRGCDSLTSSLRVVVVGEPAPGGLRSSIVASFAQLGHQVETVDWGPWRPTYLASAAFRVPRLGAGFRLALRRQIDKLGADGAADLILVAKGPLIDSHTVEYFRRRLAAPVVCWNPDSPFDDAISNRGGGIPEAISAYDMYVTWAADIAEQVCRYNHNVVVIPFGWDPLVHPPTAGRGVAEGRIVFVGTATEDRAAILSRIAHLRPLVFGNGWPAITGIEIRPPVYREEMSAVVGEARWNLNILRPQNARSHNMRTFELPGAQGNQIVARTPDHERFFGGDTRTLLFGSAAEMEEILRSDPSRLKPRDPEVLRGHTYTDRVEALRRAMNLD